MKTIKLTSTQHKCLIKALKELIEAEHDCGCNDCFSGDKFYLLTKKEQKEAIKNINKEDIIFLDDNDKIEIPFNSTATEYLLKLIK